MTAINSAIEVDLTGQVVADSIGHRMYWGVGGQMDFIRGAALAARGPGDHRAAVDRGRGHGVADRRRASGGRRRGDDAGACPGRSSPSTASPSCSASSLRERARALIAIAHPEFRDSYGTTIADPEPHKGRQA